MAEKKEPPFFVGYFSTPAPIKAFMALVALFLLGAFSALALSIASGQGDPGTGNFQWAWGQQVVTGRLETLPYPVLHITQGTKHLAAGNSLLLSGVGKKGIQKRVEELDGKLVQLKGIALQRGDIRALQVGDGQDAIAAVDGTTTGQEVKQLGRWRLKGEICDGKCLAGAMRPGRGMSHRACANLCLIGGAPPVFVAADAVDNQDFFLIGDSNGNPLPADYLNYVALLVSLEGTVERRGELLVFKADWSTLQVL